MFDKNGHEIKTGDIVEITGAYFKNDNGLYFVDNSPGDPNWSGKDHCLHKISKTGRISKAKYNICFWPIMNTVSNWANRCEANAWNTEHAQIEVKTIKNMEEVAQHFEDKAEEMTEQIKWEAYNFGEDSETVTKFKKIQAHYRAVATRIRR